MVNAVTTPGSIDIQQTAFSSLYESANAASYANQVDDETLLADFEAASRRFATDAQHLGTCAHALPAFLMEVRRNDEKLNAALGKKPAIIGRLIQSEKIKGVFEARERVHTVLHHS